jgi:Fe-S cluster biosynthesis and repair protein YggX
LTPDERIEQFRKMAKANPDDDLAHFALGQALAEAKRHAEAINVLRQVVRMNDSYSRAWLLMGEAQAALDDIDGAIESWQTGHQVATRRGDMLPARDIKDRLAAHGQAPTQAEAPLITVLEPEPIDDRKPGPDEVRDLRTRRVGKRMRFDPFGDAIGAFIFEHISQESWDAWMEMSIKVINELRLDLGDPSGQVTYDEQMRSFLNLPEYLFEGRTYE